MKFKDLIGHLDEAFPKSLSIPGDDDGVDVGFGGDYEIAQILVALDVTLDAIYYAQAHAFDCIISHHQLIREPLAKLDFSGVAAKKAALLARGGICSAAFHTRLDCVGGGVNDCLIGAAGIKGAAEPLTAHGVPIGRIVTLKEETSLSAFMAGITKSMKKYYKAQFSCEAQFGLSYTGASGAVKKIGVVGGGGMDFAHIAAKAGADTFFTGEGKYGAVLDLFEEYGINVITAGHFETEAVVLPFVKETILSAFPKAQVECFVG